ncbi:unnamed protein product [Anisakis simplex]|uniref:Ig-like domain-containing protein n=1 Tax=Anisakis simplex TaxID=6269 RepID=A0A3P6TH92_ANISI|nr:unnamed protein product [Anisakis simplex]
MLITTTIISVRIVAISEPQKPTVETTSISIQEGTSVTIACSIQGASGEELHWRRADDQYMSFDASDENGILTISNVKVFDAAEYICYTYDRMTGERIDSEPVNLVVTPSDEERTEEDLFGEDRERPQPEPEQELEPEPERELPLEPAVEPKPTIEKSTVTVDQGETITLKCSIPVRDSETILHWRRADGQSMGWHITETDGTLTIENIQPSDAGAYICSAEDTETYEIVDSEPAHITVLPLTQQPTESEVSLQPVVDSFQESVDEGDTVTLRCSLAETNHINEFSLTWRREDGEALSADANTEERGVLTLTNVKVSDSGTYICTAEDTESGQRIDSVPAYLTVNPSMSETTCTSYIIAFHLVCTHLNKPLTD